MSDNPYYSEYFAKERARQSSVHKAAGGVHYAPPVQGLTNYHDTTSYRRSWWEQELDAVDGWDDSDWSGRSVSSTRSVLGNYATYERKWGNDPTDKLNKVACEVVRLMNSVRNSAPDDKSEKILSISWSEKDNERNNTPGSTEIVLSPDWIVGNDGTADNSKTPEVVDAIGGQALLGSTLKRTMSRMGYSASMNDTSHNAENNRALWRSLETAVAKQSLIKDWPGAAPYLWRHQTLTTSKAEEVNAFIANNPTSLSAAVAATAWNIANPKHKLELPADMEAHVAEACKVLNSSSKDDRYSAARSAVELLEKHFKDPPKGKDSGDGGASDPSKPPTDSGAGSDPSKGDGSGDGKSKSPSTTPPKAPTVTDASLFGEKVKSHSDKVPSSIKTSDDLDKFDIPEVPKGCGRCDKTVWSDGLDSSVPDRTLSHKEAYAMLSKGVQPITKAILGSMRFRMLETNHPIYGVHTGDLDEGSIFKIGVRSSRQEHNPSVFMRNEVASIPDVAVCILVDESGSMSSCKWVDSDAGLLEQPSVLAEWRRRNKGKVRIRRSQAARAVAVAMTEALTRLRGVHLSVYGHTQFDCGHVDMIRYFDKKAVDRTSMASIHGRADNADGYAIMASMREMYSQYHNAKQKYLFVISDGLPHASGHDNHYSGDPALGHISNVVNWGRKKFGIYTYGIGVEGAFGEEIGTKMYGKGNFVCLPDTMSAAGTIARFLARVTSKV